MSRNLTTKQQSTDRFKNKLVLDAAFGGVDFVAPTSEIYVTMVGAGGRGYNTSWSFPNTLSGYVSVFGRSPSGKYLFMVQSYSGGSSDVMVIDPAGKKIGMWSQLNIGGAYCFGNELLVSDSGFIYPSSQSESYSPYYSTDAGLTWTSGLPTRSVNNSETAMIQGDGITDTAVVQLVSNAYQVGYWNGSSFASMTVGDTSKNFKSVSSANGYVILGENNGTTKTSLYYKTRAQALTNSAWSSVVIDGTNNVPIYDVIYGNGVYVAVGESGKIYTANDIAGTWTSRTSGTSQTFSTVSYVNNRFFACDAAGNIATSTDAITWTYVTTTSGYSRRRRDSVVYDHINNAYIARSSNGNACYYSTDNGATWSSAFGGTGCQGGIMTAAGFVYKGASTTMYLATNLTSAGSTFSTNGDGSQSSVVRKSSGAVIAKASGGLMYASQTQGGDGGSSSVMRCSGGQNTIVAEGYGGNSGAWGTTYAAQGTGGVAGTNLAGGGGTPLLESILNTHEGQSIPGGAGAGWTTSYYSGGGGTVFTRGGAGGQAAGFGGGGGGYNASGAAGGGAEAVIRKKINCTIGETLTFFTGLAVANKNYPTSNGKNGFIMVEYGD